MKSLLIIIALVGIVHSNEIDSLIGKLSTRKCLYSLLKVTRASKLDTVIMNGEIAIGKGNFYVCIGDERYLQNDTSGLWGWAAGGDATRVGDVINSGNLGEIIKDAEKNFDISAIEKEDGWRIIGTARTIDNPIDSFRITISKRLLPKILLLWDNRGTRIEFLFNEASFKCPPESIFVFPKWLRKIGVGVH